MFPVKIFGVVLKSYCNRNVHAALPSTPILPSPSVSPALRNAFVSASVRALAEAEKFCRNSLGRRSTLNFDSRYCTVILKLDFWWIYLVGFILPALRWTHYSEKEMGLLQLILLDEATLVLVNDAKGLSDFIFGFASKADLSKETFVAERISRCKKRSDNLISRQLSWLSFNSYPNTNKPCTYLLHCSLVMLAVNTVNTEND